MSNISNVTQKSHTNFSPTQATWYNRYLAIDFSLLSVNWGNPCRKNLFPTSWWSGVGSPNTNIYKTIVPIARSCFMPFRCPDTLLPMYIHLSLKGKFFLRARPDIRSAGSIQPDIWHPVRNGRIIWQYPVRNAGYPASQPYFLY